MTTFKFINKFCWQGKLSDCLDCYVSTGNEKMEKRREAQVHMLLKMRNRTKIHHLPLNYRWKMPHDAQRITGTRSTVRSKGRKCVWMACIIAPPSLRRETFCEKIVRSSSQDSRSRELDRRWLIDLRCEGIHRRRGRSFANRIRYFYSSFIRRDSTLRQPFDRKTR